jgi:hypothetical protein
MPGPWMTYCHHRMKKNHRVKQKILHYGLRYGHRKCSSTKLLKLLSMKLLLTMHLLRMRLSKKLL